MAATIHRDPRIVDRRLSQYFNSRREQWIDIVKEAVRARAACTDDHAKSAPGYHAWDAGTARLRQVFRPEGWQRGDHNGIETIVSHDFKRMVAVMNTDAGTADHTRSPRNRTSKGPACEQIVDLNNQLEMFKRHEMTRLRKSPYSLWYLCIFDDGKSVRAELSTPIEFSAGYVIGFSERIFILESGDWEKVIIAPLVENGPQTYEVNVRRK